MMVMVVVMVVMMVVVMVVMVVMMMMVMMMMMMVVVMVVMVMVMMVMMATPLSIRSSHPQSIFSLFFNQELEFRSARKTHHVDWPHEPRAALRHYALLGFHTDRSTKLPSGVFGRQCEGDQCDCRQHFDHE